MAGATALAVLVLVSCAAWASATDHTVGDSEGWDLSVDYSTWTTGKAFAVGDRLLFNYQATKHNVEEVSASAYPSCSSSNAISTDSSGATVISLNTSGNHYFICGIDGHCNSGMKLEVDVASSGTTTPSTTSPPPPSGSGTPPGTTGNNSAAGSPSPALAVAVLVGLMVLKDIF